MHCLLTSTVGATLMYIRTLKAGYQATVRKSGVNKCKTFPDKAAAQLWAAILDENINNIKLLSDVEIAALSDTEIEALGGVDVFTCLGKDLFSIKNAANLESIKLLSRKEALALSPQQIESLGGKELFDHANVRVMYKSFREVCEEYLIAWDKNYKDYTNHSIRVAYWCDVFGDRIISDVETLRIYESLIYFTCSH